MTSSIIFLRSSVLLSIFNSCSSTYFSGSMSSLNIASNTSLATVLLITLSSISFKNLLKLSAENLTSSGSIPFSFTRRIVSTINQLLASFGLLPFATAASNKTVKGLYKVKRFASYSGSPYSSMYLSFFSSLNSGCSDFNLSNHSSLILIGTKSGSGKYL